MLAGPFLEPSWPWFLHIPQSLALIPHPWCGLDCRHPWGTVLQQAADLRRLTTCWVSVGGGASHRDIPLSERHLEPVFHL